MTHREAVFDDQPQSKVPGTKGSSAQPDNRGFSSAIEQLVDMLFSALKLVFPASISTTLKAPVTKPQRSVSGWQHSPKTASHPDSKYRPA